MYIFDIPKIIFQNNIIYIEVSNSHIIARALQRKVFPLDGLNFNHHVIEKHHHFVATEPQHHFHH
jgi:hypothetical protein